MSSRSFNRYASWLAQWNAKSGKRWVLWQIPLGNSNHLDVCKSGGSRQGYKDNRAEYFFGAESATHLASWAQSGVIALLFGAGATCQSSYGNDTYTDGQSFIQSRVGAFYAAGGLPLTASGGGAGCSNDAGAREAGSTDSSEYGFESGLSGWTGASASVAVSSARASAGARSLAVSLATSGSATATASVASPATPAGAKVTFHVWIPAGSKLSSVQPYVLQGAAGNWAWSGNWQAAASLHANAWNTITVAVPAGASPLYQLGVQFTTSGAWSGIAYVDAISW